jgi:nucleotidyltransferase substrate binding protein (TIGR01987 family)
MNNDIRWVQRFNNFNNAFLLLQSALQDRPLDTLSDLEQEGIIQRFEYTYELAWKTMKDYMEENGIILDEITPRAVIKSAFAANLIQDGQVWIDMMIHRNLLSHTYDIKIFKIVLIAVTTLYFPAINELHDLLSSKVSEI